MPNSLPPLSQSSATSAPSTRGELVSSLSKLLGISRGSTVSASVELVSTATPAQRKTLLSQNVAHLAVLNPISNSPSIKLQIDKLMEQQVLLRSPSLALAQLQVNGKSMLTYTTQPLQPGQTIEVKLDTQQRLIQLAVAPAVANPMDPADPQQLFRTEKTQTLLAGLMRSLLPQKDAPQQLLAALPKILNLPAQQRDQLLPGNLQQALKTLADQLPSPEQLANPKRLPGILKNSGVQFEQKLAHNFVSGQNPAKPSSEQAPVSPRAFAGALTPTTPLATASSPTTPTTNPQASLGAADVPMTQDRKGALLQLLHRIDQNLGRELPAPASASAPLSHSAIEKPTTAALTAALSPPSLLAQATPQPFSNLTQLMNYINARPQAELSNKVLRTQLLLLLHQHTLGSLAKIQLQQLHTLNHHQGQADSLQPTQSWLFDIPVRLGQDIHQLEVRIDEEWVADEQNPDQRDKKARQWSVMLSFDLPQHGGFYAQLTLVNDSVSAKLWADQETTLLQAQQKLEALRQQLQSQGIEVKQLQCLKGAPPHRSISLNYALVDITT
jgi:hypothetical protein